MSKTNTLWHKYRDTHFGDSVTSIGALLAPLLIGVVLAAPLPKKDHVYIAYLAVAYGLYRYIQYAINSHVEIPARYRSKSTDIASVNNKAGANQKDCTDSQANAYTEEETQSPKHCPEINCPMLLELQLGGKQ